MTDVSVADLRFERIFDGSGHEEELYELLRKRQHCISHLRLPSFEQHCAFVKAHPYRAWFLVKRYNEAMGAVYLGHDNGIGLTAVGLESLVLAASLSFILENFDPLPEIKSVRASSFHVNVAPSDSLLEDFLRGSGALHIQSTFMIPKNAIPIAIPKERVA
jgi:hypothetical protein